MSDNFKVKVLMLKGEKGEKGDTGSVENLEIGVRNLLVINKLELGGITSNGKEDLNYFRMRSDYIDCIKVKNITIKAHDIGDYKGIRIAIHSYNENKQHLKDSGWINLNVGEKYVYSLSDNDIYIKIIFSFSKTSNIVTTGVTEATEQLQLDVIKNKLKFKLEKTNVASDYTVAQEDIENEINNIKARLEALEAK